MLDIALQYARRGWRVFPVSFSKIPFRGCAWSTLASRDPAEIEALFARFGRGRRQNVALATGDMVVFDADGAAGLERFKSIPPPGAHWPLTLTHRTPRGGWHFIYAAPAGRILRGFNDERPSGQPGLDVKAHGGYVLSPHSRTKAGVYRVADGLDILPAELPAWAADWIDRRGDPDRAPRPAGTNPARASAGLPGMGPRPAYLDDTSTSLTERAVALREPWSRGEEARLRSALSAIKLENLGYDKFLHIGFGLQWLAWTREDGTDIGFQLYDEFCSRSPYYDQAGLEYKWGTYGRNTANVNPVTTGTIYDIAKAHGWDGTVIYDAPNGSHSIFADQVQASAGPEAIVFPDREKSGKPKPTCRNARVAIGGLAITCEHDTFHNRMLLGGQFIAQWAGELSDDAVQMLRVLIERHFGFDPGLQNAHDAAVQECLLRPFDPVASYLDGLAWDGRPRLGAWLTTYMGAADTALTRNIGGLGLVAAVRRARRPGTKFDQIIVLESPEGRGKSTALEILAGTENFSDQLILTLDDKGQQEAVQGVWVYEIGDLAGMGRADVERVKAFASRKVDRARPAYGRTRVDRARRCVFFATTNDDTYLLSQTGNRRFWPVRVGRIDLDALARDRDQLWAEAAHYEAGGLPLLLPESLWAGASAEQEARQVHDSWLDVLARLPSKPCEENPAECRITTFELFTAHLQVGAERMSPTLSKRLGYVMRRLGWHGPKVMKFSGNVPARGYWRPVTAERP